MFTLLPLQTEPVWTGEGYQFEILSPVRILDCCHPSSIHFDVTFDQKKKNFTLYFKNLSSSQRQEIFSKKAFLVSLQTHVQGWQSLMQTIYINVGTSVHSGSISGLLRVISLEFSLWREFAGLFSTRFHPPSLDLTFDHHQKKIRLIVLK